MKFELKATSHPSGATVASLALVVVALVTAVDASALLHLAAVFASIAALVRSATPPFGPGQREAVRSGGPSAPPIESVGRCRDTTVAE
ncbi:MAG: hypothetical protein GY773_15935 [Actinomycetia bacterium]|nr:hypothetical protein [Actinomycetes bacterium]MCP5034472.1 hypothetical protein [Actinomycetes bacterium]